MDRSNHQQTKVKIFETLFATITSILSDMILSRQFSEQYIYLFSSHVIF